MPALMQYEPLLLSALLEYAAQTWPDTPVVSRDGDHLVRSTYGETARRARRLASSLRRLGVNEGDFVGSLAWTTHRHFELMYAVPGIGAVLHTANPRLSEDHITFTINHAGERVLFVDRDCVAQVEAMLPGLAGVDTFVIMASRTEMPDSRLPNAVCYEELVAQGDEGFTWPVFDERLGSNLCFTSGTTGDPKGVLYSHRGTYISALAIAAPNVWAVSRDDAIIVLAPFFHCNGWGAPYLGPISGARLILPGRAMDGRSIHQLIVNEGATMGPGVPTVWMTLAEYCRENNERPGRLNRIICGGAAPPLDMMRTFWREFGVRTIQVWGMTETMHAATAVWTDKSVLSGEKEPDAPQGQPVPGIGIRILDGDGKPLPKDGKSMGHLQVKGHSCAAGYLKRPDVALTDEEGWLNTGDLAQIQPGSRLRITDRLKDVIKSGGEWVSSIDLENAAIGHPGVAEAAVIGVPHPRWQERPVMYVVRRAGVDVSADALREHLAGAVVKWWLPDEIIFVEALPYNSTGKVKKDVLRTRYREATGSGTRNIAG